MKGKTNKILIMAIIALFVVATVPLVSSADNRVIESKTGGDKVTETFNLCHINSSGYGYSIHIPGGITGRGLLFLSTSYFGLENTTTTIKIPKETLTIYGEHDIALGKVKPRIIKFLDDFRLPISRFFGAYNLGQPFTGYMGPLSLEGYGIGVEVTYYT